MDRRGNLAANKGSKKKLRTNEWGRYKKKCMVDLGEIF